jgi:uncharacterized protein YecT (DUF1311 family)
MRGAALALGLAIAAPAAAQSPADRHMAGVPRCFAAAATAEAARACVGTGSAACMQAGPDGQTTSGMVECLASEAGAWDRLLNAEYALTRDWARALDDADRPYGAESARRVDSLRTAQRAWIAFRDAECDFAGSLHGSGSLGRILGADCFLQMTATRTIDLRHWRFDD